MITVIIPVLNESESIVSVIEFARRDPQVSEVIVVDDGSIDGTPDLARAAGATVITSSLLGKGASMQDGMWAAHNEVLLYLDGDLSGLHEDLIRRMTDPILEGRADFVKARFSRSAGRVTTLTARPLLQTFFPELAGFDQPLSGVMAARRSLLRKLKFEDDYGVDIGLFLDAAATGIDLAEADIGHLEHDSHPLEVLGDMATQVVRTLLDRAARYGRLKRTHIREVVEVERHGQAEISVALQNIGQVERLALFDMDGVLLKGRFIVSLAQRVNKTAELAAYLDNFDLQPEERTFRIAALFTGIRREVFEQVARDMPLMPGASETVVSLRKSGFRVGIVTDSFLVAADIIRRRVFADFSFAHLMKFQHGKATGQVRISPAMIHPQGCLLHPHCKVNVMRHLMERMEISAGQVVAIGDGMNDVCMLEDAGISVAFQPKSPLVRAAAGHTVEGALTEVLAIIQAQTCDVPTPAFAANSIN